MAKKAIKIFVDEEMHDLLHENKAQTGATISETMNALVYDVLKPEVEGRREEEGVAS